MSEDIELVNNSVGICVLNKIYTAETVLCMEHDLANLRRLHSEEIARNREISDENMRLRQGNIIEGKCPRCGRENET